MSGLQFIFLQKNPLKQQINRLKISASQHISSIIKLQIKRCKVDSENQALPPPQSGGCHLCTFQWSALKQRGNKAPWEGKVEMLTFI